MVLKWKSFLFSFCILFVFVLGLNDVENEVSLLVNLYGDLLNSTYFISAGFRLPLLFAVLNCFLHLVITGYFAYIEVSSDNYSWKVFSMQILWIIYHIIGLLIIVQPCYWCIILVWMSLFAANIYNKLEFKVKLILWYTLEKLDFRKI